MAKRIHVSTRTPYEIIVGETTANLTLYVDVATGSDSNDGLAAGTGRALATIQAACDKIPAIVNHKVIVNIAAGTYTGGFILQNKTIGAFSGQTGSTDFAIQFLGAAPTTVDTGTSTGVDGSLPKQLLIDTGKTWSNNSMRGKLLTIGGSTYVIRRSGTASGLADNNTLEIVGIAGSNLGPSIAYTIKDWSTIVTGANARTGYNMNALISHCQGTRLMGAAVYLSYLKFVAPTSSTSGIGIRCDSSDTHFSFVHVDMSGNSTAATSGIQLYQINGARIEDTYIYGSNSNCLGCQIGTNIRALQRVCAVHGQTGVNIFDIPNIGNMDYIYCDDQTNNGITLSRCGYVNGTIIYIDGKVTTNTNVVGLYAVTTPGLCIFTGGIIENCKYGFFHGYESTATAVAIRNGAFSSMQMRGAFAIRNCTSHAAVLLGPTYTKVSTMTGTGNGGYGFFIREGSKLFLTPATTLTGTTGDVSFDGNALTYTSNIGTDGDVASHMEYGTLVKNING